MADNSSTINIAGNLINKPRTKHIDVAYQYPSEHRMHKYWTLSYVQSYDNTDNLMTKGLYAVAQNVHTQRLNLWPWEGVLRDRFCALR